MFSYAQTSSFAVRYLGKVSYVAPQSNVGSSESQIGTLEDIDRAQVRKITQMVGYWLVGIVITPTTTINMPLPL